jgi:hypothetical protein
MYYKLSLGPFPETGASGKPPFIQKILNLGGKGQEKSSNSDKKTFFRSIFPWGQPKWG